MIYPYLVVACQWVERMGSNFFIFAFLCLLWVSPLCLLWVSPCVLCRIVFAKNYTIAFVDQMLVYGHFALFMYIFSPG